MSEFKLKYTDVVEESWNSFRDQLPLTAGLSLVFICGMAVLFYIPVFGHFLMSPFGLGYLKCLIQIRKKEKFDFPDFFWAFSNLNRFIHATLLGFLIALGYLGFILLLVPGIWWFVVTTFSNVIFISGTEDCIAAIKKSMQMVEGRWWNVAGLIGFLSLINLAGAMFFLIGVIISLPVTTLALYIAFEKLLLNQLTHLQTETLQSVSAEAPVPKA